MLTLWSHTLDISYYFMLGIDFGNSVEPQLHYESGQKSGISTIRLNTIVYIIFFPPVDKTKTTTII